MRAASHYEFETPDLGDLQRKKLSSNPSESFDSEFEVKSGTILICAESSLVFRI